MNFSGDKSFIGAGPTLTFVPATSLLDRKTFWEKHGGRIITFVGFVLLLMTLVFIVDHQMSRPVMDVNSRAQAVQIKFEDGRVLNPGDPGFDSARKKAAWNYVH